MLCKYKGVEIIEGHMIIYSITFWLRCLTLIMQYVQSRSRAVESAVSYKNLLPKVRKLFAFEIGKLKRRISSDETIKADKLTGFRTVVS